ncbi:MAG: ZIP zinc transporter [Candidatus Doudnabacteria bacterium CG10_big_fil_rev_8_21_14_0_10_41_10]|uniref:ZIP zinc transporter n=1 Tax=Candidatus Doudnabacteria bacterium CG10_big_fil_rev_8_21_14_0_10_41_10 TaxID=1974551 RepID=A0A2H0VCY7_9BACT|nr:MAG: ZIP zinc transporter [Candidatus Doudnabacteria bacterium CG10_big_fil_rev_8_21_14_0_10_41_10]
MNLLLQIILYSAASGILALIGALILLGNTKLTKKFSIHLVSFATGTLLAIAFLNLLPEALETAAGESHDVFAWALAGLIAFFLFERIVLKLHFHFHEEDGTHKHPTPVLLLAGDAFHNFIDGAAIAAAFLVNSSLGIVIAIGVALHEVPQEIGDFSIMLHHGWKKSLVFWSNFAIALTAVLGAVMAYIAKSAIEPYLPYLLAFTAGSFIYIAAADLIPEITREKPLDKKSHTAILLLFGVFIVWLFSNFTHGH